MLRAMTGLVAAGAAAAPSSVIAGVVGSGDCVGCIVDAPEPVADADVWFHGASEPKAGIASTPATSTTSVNRVSPLELWALAAGTMSEVSVDLARAVALPQKGDPSFE